MIRNKERKIEMMKKILAFSIIVLSLTLCGGALAANDNTDKSPDYSQPENWCNLPEITKDIDTFFIYPTEYMGFNEGDSDYASIDNTEMRNGAKACYVLQASAYESSTNVFMPYYRQAGMAVMKKSWLETGNVYSAVSGIPYKDITAALDYYFTNCNDGRPFIIAGHSQGSAITMLVLMQYFKEHQEYYKRMIAVYPIGYSVPKMKTFLLLCCFREQSASTR